MRVVALNEQWEPLRDVVVEVTNPDTKQLMGLAYTDNGGIADFSDYSAITATARLNFRTRRGRGGPLVESRIQLLS